jgi:hypothetical protein
LAALFLHRFALTLDWSIRVDLDPAGMTAEIHGVNIISCPGFVLTGRTEWKMVSMLRTFDQTRRAELCSEFIANPESPDAANYLE